jgi:hypothetical protein
VSLCFGGGYVMLCGVPFDMLLCCEVSCCVIVIACDDVLLSCCVVCRCNLCC